MLGQLFDCRSLECIINILKSNLLFLIVVGMFIVWIILSRKKKETSKEESEEETEKEEDKEESEEGRCYRCGKKLDYDDLRECNQCGNNICPDCNVHFDEAEVDICKYCIDLAYPKEEKIVYKDRIIEQEPESDVDEKYFE